LRAVKLLIKFIFFLLFFVYALLFFAPKKEIYYMVEQKIKPLDIIIDKESFYDNGFVFGIDNADIYFKGIKSARLDSINITMLLFYNKISIPAFRLNDDFSDFLPAKIKFINIKHTILNPLEISINAKGDFGKADGVVDLKTRTIKILFRFSKTVVTKYRQTLRGLKKTKEGYRYEYHF